MLRLEFAVPYVSAFIHLYNTVIRPHLKYAVQIWWLVTSLVKELCDCHTKNNKDV